MLVDCSAWDYTILALKLCSASQWQFRAAATLPSQYEISFQARSAGPGSGLLRTHDAYIERLEVRAMPVEYE